MMRSFFGQHLFYHFIILSLFLNISICAEVENDEFPRRNKDGKLILDCKDMEIDEYMSKHVFVSENSPDDIELKCPVESMEFVWEAKYLQSSDQTYGTVHNFHFTEVNEFNSSGTSLETFALNLGKPDKGKSGIYCCKKSANGRMRPFLSHAVLILPKAPEITLTSSNSNLGEDLGELKSGDDITLHCSEERYDIPDAYPKPKRIWEKNCVIINNATEPEYSFTVNSVRYHNASFRCGLRYENLDKEIDLKPFYSSSISLKFDDSVLLEELCTTRISEPINVRQGNSTTLTCSFTSNSPECYNDLAWTRVKCNKPRSEEPIPSIDIDTHSEVKFGHFVEQTDEFTNFSLTINNFTKEDDVALYICKLGNQREFFKVQFSEPELPQPQLDSLNTASRNSHFMSLALILVSLATAFILVSLGTVL